MPVLSRSTLEALWSAHPRAEKALPIGVLHFAIADVGHSQAELLGSASRASEILNRRRPLTLDMIRIISDAWEIPRDALTDAYDLSPASKPKRGARKDRQVSDAA